MTQWIKDGDDTLRMRHVDTINCDSHGNAEFIVDPPCLGFAFTSIDAHTARFGGLPFRVEVAFQSGRKVVDCAISPISISEFPQVFYPSTGWREIVANQGLFIRVSGQPLDVVSFVFTGKAPEGWKGDAEPGPEPEPEFRDAEGRLNIPRRVARLANSAPTPATHRYVGMWRPPLAEVIRREFVQHPSGEFYFDCPCGSVCFRCSAAVRGPCDAASSLTLLNHWLAGHFDEPQYEAKAQ